MRDFVGPTASTTELTHKLVEFILKFLPPENALHRLGPNDKVFLHLAAFCFIFIHLLIFVLECGCEDSREIEIVVSEGVLAGQRGVCQVRLVAEQRKTRCVCLCVCSCVCVCVRTLCVAQPASFRGRRAV